MIIYNKIHGNLYFLSQHPYHHTFTNYTRYIAQKETSCTTKAIHFQPLPKNFLPKPMNSTEINSFHIFNLFCDIKSLPEAIPQNTRCHISRHTISNLSIGYIHVTRILDAISFPTEIESVRGRRPVCGFNKGDMAADEIGTNDG